MGTQIPLRTSVLTALTALLIGVLGSPAAAGTDGISDYPVSGSPGDITAGPDGSMWFTEPAGIGIIDSAGARTSSQPGSGRIGRITRSGTVTEFPLPAKHDSYRITAGPDGNLWFTETIFGANPSDRRAAIGRITTSGAITEFPLETGGGASQGMPDGPQGIAAGPDGNVWFTMNAPFTAGAIARITPEGVITQYPVPSGLTGPQEIVTGPDANLWFTASNSIGRVTPSGTFSQYPVLTPSAGPTGIVAGPDGNIWFTEKYAGRIGRVSPSGTVSEFALTGADHLPSEITAGPDGNLWFADERAYALGRITPMGATTEYKLPTFPTSPHGIAAGADGYIWFTASGHVGRLSTGATPISAWSCPLDVTLHHPVPKAAGSRLLTHRITTNNFCKRPKATVRCRSVTTVKHHACNVRIGKRGRIRIHATSPVRVTVTVKARPKPEIGPGFPGPWKTGSWRKSWTLR